MRKDFFVQRHQTTLQRFDNSFSPLSDCKTNDFYHVRSIFHSIAVIEHFDDAKLKFFLFLLKMIYLQYFGMREYLHKCIQLVSVIKLNLLVKLQRLRLNLL